MHRALQDVWLTEEESAGFLEYVRGEKRAFPRAEPREIPLGDISLLLKRVAPASSKAGPEILSLDDGGSNPPAGTRPDFVAIGLRVIRENQALFARLADS